MTDVLDERTAHSAWEELDAPDADEPRSEAQDRRLRRLRTSAWAAAGTLALALGYLPMARVPIVADDLQALFRTYHVTHGNFWTALRWGAAQGHLAGHFNPVGQALGAAYHFTAYWLSATLGVSPQYYDVLTYLVLIWATIAGATSVLAWGLGRRAGHRRPGYWPLFAVLCALTAATLQIHAPWSNDPVVSFGPAGWGSAALAFWFVAWAVRAVQPGATGWRSLAGCSVLGIVCVWYYEMLLGAVAAVATAVVLTALLARGRADVRRRCVLLFGTGVVLPGILFVLGRSLTVSSGGYGGTQTEFDAAAIGTWSAGMRGALPGGGWRYMAEASGTPVLRIPTLLIAAALCVVIGGIGLAWSRSLRAGRPDDDEQDGQQDGAGRRAVVVLAALVVLWATVTATQAISVQYIRQIRHPGQVYLFYSTGVVCVAALIAVALLQCRPRVRVVLLVALAPVAGLFVTVQVASNMTAADTLLSAWPGNGALVAMSTKSDASPAARCAALQKFVDTGFPAVYSDEVAYDLNHDYQDRYGRPFCASIPGAPGP